MRKWIEAAPSSFPELLTKGPPEGDPRTLSDRQARERAWFVSPERESPERDADADLGALARIALAGDWIAAVDGRDSTNDTARMPEVMRLMGVCVQCAARSDFANALDAARSAAAWAPEVQELQDAVRRAIQFLE